MDRKSIVFFHNANKDFTVVGRQLKAASKIIEDVAYALAGDVPSDRVTRLMLLSVEVDRLAGTLRKENPRGEGILGRRD